MVSIAGSTVTMDTAALLSSVRASSTMGFEKISSIDGTSNGSGLAGMADMCEGLERREDLKFSIPRRWDATRFLGIVTDRGLGVPIFGFSVITGSLPKDPLANFWPNSRISPSNFVGFRGRFVRLSM